MTSFKMEGLKELNNMLKRLPGRVADKQINQSAAAAAAVIRKEARQNLVQKIKNIDDGTEQTLRGVVSRKAERSSTHVTYHIGAIKKRFYLNFIELGADPHIIKSKGKSGAKVLANKDTQQFFGKTVKHPGVKMQPWLRPALDQNKEKAVNKLRDRLRAGIEKEVAKLR